ncbi:MAG: amidohydrolase family protein [Acidimicrobiia bacterium]
MKLFSVDDHIVEPADLWTSRLPTRLHDVAPHVLTDDDGTEFWTYEGKRHRDLALNAVVGKPKEEWDREPLRFSEMRPGCYDPVARAHDFLSEEITASVAFPTLPRFGGALFPDFADEELADLCVKAWNDYVHEQWCPAAPEMYVPMAIVQLWDPVAAAAEIERNLDRGFKAIAIPEETSHLGLPSYWDPVWDPIWSTCEQAGVPVCMHIASSGWQPFKPPEAGDDLLIALGFVPTITHAVGMAFGPVPRKFPDIKLVYSEGGIGWVPVTLERADSRYELHKSWSGADDLSPSEVFRRNMWFCMMPDEQYGLRNRHDVGLDRIFWETDYPHANCPWPGTQAMVREMLDGVPEHEARAIAYENAERVFGWTCVDPDQVTVARVAP